MRPIFTFKATQTIAIVIASLFFSQSLLASIPGPGKYTTQPRLTATQYCEKYADEARRQMQKYGIPASITLAQGMLESGYGSSYLAVVAKNHFGIKAYRGWNGPIVRIDDDAKAEPFCKFNTVEESYEYHSTFLKQNQRYAFLFSLNSRDYESWAKGLKKAGYATNPKYAESLIRIIEENHLDVYDAAKGPFSRRSGTRNYVVAPHKLYVTSTRRGLKYVRANADDDLSFIAKEFNISKRNLRKYNDLHKLAVLMEGDIIYLQPKRSKAEKQFPAHVVKAGESLHRISQMYGVTVSSLIKRNKLSTATVYEGQVLKLR